MLRLTHMRWTMGAREIMFKGTLDSAYFSLARIIPVERGKTVYQEGVNACIDVLNNNGWVQIFPEGKVNQGKLLPRLKWGVGRLVFDADTTPLVVPIYHRGLEKSFPLDRPTKFLPSRTSRWDIIVGDPISFDELVRNHIISDTNPEDVYKIITAVVREKLFLLEETLESKTTQE
eukprot:TRINITY_DN6238_c0_g1_i1.p1 TRINITY_DN6238_c0_g1~~TRINITY_DN6238_c0_g1_i1.p1  ORF type:complete len:175 (-),score=20.12 TRINITY_DN6238_c0_g1_i1:165-689(-)